MTAGLHCEMTRNYDEHFSLLIDSLLDRKLE